MQRGEGPDLDLALRFSNSGVGFSLSVSHRNCQYDLRCARNFGRRLQAQSCVRSNCILDNRLASSATFPIFLRTSKNSSQCSLTKGSVLSAVCKEYGDGMHDRYKGEDRKDLFYIWVVPFGLDRACFQNARK